MNKRRDLYALVAFFLATAGLTSGCTSTPSETHTRVDVTIRQMQFTPAQITVHKGDTVVFTNKDIVMHDVTEERSDAWTSGPLPVDSSFTFIATENAVYYCSIHPMMKGKMILAK